MANKTETRFTTNGTDTIYHQANENSMRFAFLVVSEYFDTPSEKVTQVLEFVCEALNKEEQS